MAGVHFAASASARLRNVLGCDLCCREHTARRRQKRILLPEPHRFARFAASDFKTAELVRI